MLDEAVKMIDSIKSRNVCRNVRYSVVHGVCLKEKHWAIVRVASDWPIFFFFA